MNTRLPNSETVFEKLPAAGSRLVTVHALAQSLPLTLQEVSQALQVLKREGRAHNPRGPHTTSWCRRAEEPVAAPAPEGPVPGPSPAHVDPNVDGRILELERHLARIEGALAGVSSRLDVAIEMLERSAERERIIVGATTPEVETR